VDHLLAALMRVAVSVDRLEVIDEFDLVGVANLDSAACLRIRHLRWLGRASDFGYCLDLSRFHNLITFESTVHASVAFDAGKACTALERFKFHSEGLVDLDGRGHDPPVHELIGSLADSSQWRSLTVVSVVAAKLQGEHEWNRRRYNAAVDAADKLREACERRGVAFELV